MPFGMAGLDFCVWNQYRNREKNFFAEGAYWKSLCIRKLAAQIRI